MQIQLLNHQLTLPVQTMVHACSNNGVSLSQAAKEACTFP